MPNVLNYFKQADKYGENIFVIGGLYIVSGDGIPTRSVPQGSLYLRSDGTTTNDRMYIATDDSGTWTAVTTVA